jgi:hypothetical protein
VGQAVGGVLAVKYSPDNQHDHSLEECVKLADVMYEKNLSEYLAEGRELVDSVESMLYPALIKPMLTAWFKKPFITDGWVVKGTEYQCADDNRSFIDVWGTNERGVWVTDWKAKMVAKAYQITQELAKYQHSWQLGHYVWSLHRMLNEWPKTAGISLLVGDPVPQHQYMEFEVNLDFMKWWEASAFKLWGQIEDAEEWCDKHPHASIEEAREHFGMSTNHMEGPWKCDMEAVCFLYDGDASVSANHVVNPIKPESTVNVKTD